MRLSLTYVLIAINLLIFIAEIPVGGSTNRETSLRFGAQYTPLLERGQWFRLFSSLFVHCGFWHLICNMYSLYCLGPALENIFGKTVFLIIYLLSGICGNLLTWKLEKMKGDYRVSMGASGAVFGLLGSCLVLAVLPATAHVFSIRGIISVLIVNIVYGVTNKSINNAAHLGGFAGGAVITLILAAILKMF